MKQPEIKPCAKCGKGVMHTGLPLFWRVTIERMAVDVGAARRQHGLEMMLGGNALIAFHMGPQEDIAKPLFDANTVLLCETCASDMVCIAALDETSKEQEQ